MELARFVTAGDRAPRGSAAPAAASPRRPPPPRPPAGRSRGPPLSLVVVVDLVTMPSDALLPARGSTIVSMARTGLEPGTRLMLVALERGLRVAQPFTDDVERFVAAVEALKPTTADGEASLAELIDQVDSACEPDLPGALQNAINAGQRLRRERAAVHVHGAGRNGVRSAATWRRCPVASTSSTTRRGTRWTRRTSRSW